MKLSIVILCWNDLKVIGDCLQSIYATTHSTSFEIIVPDNGSTDGSIEFIRKNYPNVRVIENGRNLRFAKANNVGIEASQGEYILILNPDTIIHEGALDKMVAFADKHPEAGGFGCRVLNRDGSYQRSARPYPTIRSEWIVALYLRPLGYISDWFRSDNYTGWDGTTERQAEWVSGCFILARKEILRSLHGFDGQFFYYYEDLDLCRRISESGHPILFTPEAVITHLGGQSTNQRFPRLTFALDSQITRYLYYYKYQGKAGVRRARRVALASSFLRWLGLRVAQFVRPTEFRKSRVELFRGLLAWNYRVNPVRLVENGEEPDLGTRATVRVVER